MNCQITRCLLASLFLVTATAGAQTGPERFDGRIVDTAQKVAGSSAYFTVQVDRWGTEEEAAAYLQLLREKGQKGLIEAFWDAKEAGWIKIGNALGYPIVFARQIPTPEGRIVRAFTDRPVQFFEQRNGLRSQDYPLGIVEMKFPAEGKGEGTLVAAASAKYDEKGQLAIEQFGTQPFRLMSIKAQPVKPKKK